MNVDAVNPALVGNEAVNGNLPAGRGRPVPLDLETDGVPNKVEGALKFWWIHLLTLPISSQITQGLAKIFDFEVLRHGTTFQKTLGIFKNGADPSKAGTGITSLAPDLEAPLGSFHLLKDSDIRLTSDSTPIDPLTKQPIREERVTTENKCPFIKYVAKRIAPHFYSAANGTVNAKDIKNPILKVIAQVAFAVVNFFSPPILFIYRKSEIGTIMAIENDQSVDSEISYRTKQPLPNSRIGLVGICTHITKDDLVKSWNKDSLHRHQVIAGVAQVALGIGLTVTGIGFFI